MATDSASGVEAARPRLTFPDRLPDLKRGSVLIFQLIWIPALLLAVVGPIAGLWFRFADAGENSALIVGSRAGLALSEDDLTRVRFPVGDAAKAAEVRPGDDIIAIEGLDVARVVPISKAGRARPHDATETDYALFSPIIEGEDEADLTIRLRSSDGTERDFRTKLGEQHIDQAAGRFGLPPILLNVIDLLHLITYPFLLFAAWILHRRKPEDLISSILSLAILFTIAAEQPSAGFLTYVLHVPEWAHRLLYDLGNICLLAGVLLFPFGQLRPRFVLVALALLPVLLVLSGDWYRATFLMFMLVAVATLFARIRQTPEGDARQQIKWALFGFSGYAFFLAAALTMDGAKLHVSSFGSQMLLELLGGLSFGLAFLTLQLGLLIALLRFRLYDAEAVISRSANFALITLGVAAVFAATADGLKQIILNYYGNTGSTAPVVFAAAIATVVISPLQERIQRWSEKRFQRNLVMLRDDLPECVRELRETASTQDLLEEMLKRVEAGVRTTRLAVLLDNKVAAVRGISEADAAIWLKEFDPNSCQDEVCASSDKTFPIRVPLQTRASEGEWIGWLLIGPRPDGSILSKDEQKALVDVAGPITMAIRIASRREEREHVLERRIEALESRLSPSPAN
ncbi:hypothetical protein GCM10023264_03290 [Sphingomonas daechungensis]